jgi:nuclear polyadenylated RNA-binding protein 3
MHLEISKPQRNTRPAQVDSARPRRSRSPDYARGSNSPRRGGPPYRSSATAGPREVDRYRGAPSDRDSRDRGRDRDDYGSRRRSPLRVRDDYRPGRRSRSRSPPARYRPRSRSPESDDVPLPRRAPGQVPEVQILVSDELDRNFIWWVEQAFRQRGATCDMLFLNPRLQLSAVVKRQVLEGVQAVVFLNRQMQQASQISIQIFDRRGDGEASFDQYDNLDPPIAAELVIRAKQSLQQHQQQLTQTPPVTQYGSYGVAPPVQQPAAPVAPQQTLQHLGALGGVSGLANLLGTLDPNSLQTLIAGLQQPQQPSQHQQPQYQPQPQPQQQMPQLGADLASLLAGAGAARQQQSAPQPQQAAQYGGGMNAFGGSAGLAALLGQAQQKVASHPHQSQQPQTQQPTQPNAGQIGNIMETLAKWKQS